MSRLDWRCRDRNGAGSIQFGHAATTVRSSHNRDQEASNRRVPGFGLDNTIVVLNPQRSTEELLLGIVSV